MAQTCALEMSIPHPEIRDGYIVSIDAERFLFTVLLTSSARISNLSTSTPSSAAATTSAGSFMGASNPSFIAVSVNPRCNPTTNVPFGASSSRSEFVADQRAALDAL